MKYAKPAGVLATVAAFFLSSCSLVSSDSEGAKWPDKQATKEMPKVPEGLEAFYGQKIDWKKCKARRGKSDSVLKCADIKVPLDYSKPDGKTITIAVAKLPAKDKSPMGTVVVNPGGPGASGIDMVMSADSYFSENLREKYDILGFDPRGVGESTAIECLDDKTLGRILDASYNPADPAQKQKEVEDTKTFVQGCEKKSGELLPFVGTESVARDLDVMRNLVGDAKLNYVGFSYGTSIGGEYAELFPKNVGRMILDGATDVTLSSAEKYYNQIMGFEKALTNYLEDCVSKGNCVLGSTVEEGRAKVKSLLETSLTTPYPTVDGSRPLTLSMLSTGIIAMLYNDQTWNSLSKAFEQLIGKNDGSIFSSVADLYNSRDVDGSFRDNSSEAIRAINCADSVPSTSEELSTYYGKAKADAPVFGSTLASDSDICVQWPYHPKKNLGPFKAKGSAPIVVVGTRNDPATPYSWAEGLHDSLENSVLVTWEGEGHTAYSRAGRCIQKPLDEYMLTGKVPKDGLTCPA